MTPLEPVTGDHGDEELSDEELLRRILEIEAGYYWRFVHVWRFRGMWPSWRQFIRGPRRWPGIWWSKP